MWRLWCWLFATCATVPPPAPPAPGPSAPSVQAEPARPPAPTPAPPAGAGREATSSPTVPAPPPAVPPPAPEPPTPPAWRRYAQPAEPADGRPVIALVIDDMGVAQPYSARAVALPAAVTLSWMPYAPRLAEQMQDAAGRGHETMLHMPMEPVGRADPGPDALRTWLPPADNLALLRAALDVVPQAVALNQHEGSVASLSVPLMDLVMHELAARRMAFLDSGTIPHSVGLRRAAAAGVPAVGRDVFLDNEPNPALIRAQLARGEAVARRDGVAVLIGHPRPATLDVLEQYLPGLPARGFVLWPISAVIAARAHVQDGAGAPTGADAGGPDGAVAPARASGAE